MLAGVLAFDRRIRLRGAQRVIEIPQGVVVRHDGLRNLYHLNAVLIDGGVADLAALTGVADAHLGDLDHRHVVFDDAKLAERLAPDLLAAGWTRQRVEFMVLAGSPHDAPAPGLAREIDGAAARGRGLARAVVTAAIERAREEQCETIVVPADADDWPQLMYARLGFTPLGRQVAFTRT